MKIRKIKSEDTIALRHAVMRKGKPVEACHFPGDDAPETFHLGVFEYDRLVTIGSFYREKNPLLRDVPQIRMRGMATLPGFRNRGYAAGLVCYALEILRKQNASMIWCNARISAAGLYLKLGFRIISAEFDIPGIGPHVVMAREIST